MSKQQIAASRGSGPAPSDTREMSKICPKTGGDFGQLGDCAKLREALKAAELGLFRWLSGSMSRDEHRELVAMIKTALAAPPRNCDVGTAKEQFERLQAFCDRYDKSCTGCPCDRPGCSLAFCFVKWAQMPYEVGGAK